MQKLIIPCLVMSFALLTGCGWLHVYQPNIQQGNLYTEQMIDRVKPGMSKEQVLNIMGNPVLSTVFRENHWAYVYTFQRKGATITRKNFDVYFSGNRVVRITRSEGVIQQ